MTEIRHWCLTELAEARHWCLAKARLSLWHRCRLSKVCRSVLVLWHWCRLTELAEARHWCLTEARLSLRHRCRLSLGHRCLNLFIHPRIVHHYAKPAYFACICICLFCSLDLFLLIFIYSSYIYSYLKKHLFNILLHVSKRKCSRSV